MLGFAQLQSKLRRAVSARISSHQISGSQLARITGFRQPHISNFLHFRRGLSLEGMDHLLRALDLSVLDLLPSRELERFVHTGSDTEYEAVPLVEPESLHQPLPSMAAIREWVKLKRTFLGRMRADTIGRRDHWLRFVLTQASPEDAGAMYPRIHRNSVLLVDRQYNSLAPYRQGEVNVYAVRMRNSVLIRSLEAGGSQLIFRAERSDVPLEWMTMDAKGRYAEKIVGRVCWASHEV